MPVENSKDPASTHRPGRPKKPPGEFVTDELEAQTKRFLEEVKGLARRRREASGRNHAGPPPRS